jgi:hypothetical protein
MKTTSCILEKIQYTSQNAAWMGSELMGSDFEDWSICCLVAVKIAVCPQGKKLNLQLAGRRIAAKILQAGCGLLQSYPPAG